MRERGNRKAGTGRGRKCRRLLDAVLPVGRLSMSMRNRQHLDSRGNFSIEDREWKSLKQEFPGTIIRRWPAFGRFGNHGDRPIHFFYKPGSYKLTPQEVPFESRFVFRTRIVVKSNITFHERVLRKSADELLPMRLSSLDRTRVRRCGARFLRPRRV